MFQRILLALDSSSARHRLLETAADLASLTGGTVHVLHIDAATATGAAALPLEDEMTAHQVLDQALLTLRDTEIPADGELVQGTTIVIPELISLAAERSKADLLVLGPHHRSLSAALFNPRVSDAVSHTARIPLLLVPTTDRARTA